MEEVSRRKCYYKKGKMIIILVGGRSKLTFDIGLADFRNLDINDPRFLVNDLGEVSQADNSNAGVEDREERELGEE